MLFKRVLLSRWCGLLMHNRYSAKLILEGSCLCEASLVACGVFLSEILAMPFMMEPGIGNSGIEILAWFCILGMLVHIWIPNDAGFVPTEGDGGKV